MSFSRKVVLTLSENKLIKSFITKHGMKLGASRFVPGETLEEAIEAVKKLNAEGLVATLDHLGEFVNTREEALASTEEILKIFDGIRSSGIKSGVSVKLTSIGLDIDKEFCFENMDRITAKAKETGCFVRIDMEDSPRIDATIEIHNRLLEKYGKEHIGLVIQSYLYRSEEDVIELGKKGVSLRIVKGAYKEPASVAYPDKTDVDRNFVKLCQIHLKNGCYTAIATHDENIINEMKAWIRENNIPDNLFEFQMLYGVRNGLQRRLVSEGYKVRVYTPFGKDWYGFFTRRIAERPANALFVLKNLFKQ
ncbi:proline dehydrogenase family protein [Staphylospora marina]|uniref:proline dehydrogenase family protein n=1 Tax=Staphylospora marina TaxID=2490858 RepID=UPI000F5BAD76|nr:proline dehydrogenase family protein [Staphylospora marina]